jgi:hypothetical protein
VRHDSSPALSGRWRGWPRAALRLRRGVWDRGARCVGRGGGARCAGRATLSGACARRAQRPSKRRRAGPMYQAGTLSGNPLAMVAGIKTLEILGRPGAYEHLDAVTGRLINGLLDAGRAAGHALCGGHISGAPPRLPPVPRHPPCARPRRGPRRAAAAASPARCAARQPACPLMGGCSLAPGVELRPAPVQSRGDVGCAAAPCLPAPRAAALGATGALPSPAVADSCL